jgi:hypothetical protein
MFETDPPAVPVVIWNCETTPVKLNEKRVHVVVAVKLEDAINAEPVQIASLNTDVPDAVLT